MSKPVKRPRVKMPSIEQDKAITGAAKSDPDARPLTRKQLEAMVPMRALRGRPPSQDRNQLVSIRYSPKVLEYFRSTGEGWQARMNRVLEAYVASETRHPGSSGQRDT
jgi:uncharacterized protein (DUF4415 family)